MQIIPNIYSSPFYITEKVSNNAFSFEQRQNLSQNKGTTPKLFVPALKAGTLEDVKLGHEIVFEDYDENEKLRSCFGLENYVKASMLINTTGEQKASTNIYIFDNHNHAFAFWHLENIEGRLQKNALLVHIDQHKDTRKPVTFLSTEDATDQQKVFEYTNTVLNVGNFIPPAEKTGLIKEVIIIDSQQQLDNFAWQNLEKIQNKSQDLILDIDLDFFSVEMDYINNQEKVDFIQKLLPYAKTITIASSPFFIEQERALHWLQKIFL